ncbi:MAG: hypothetical protein ABW321_06215 [Polyangiales bacterium]
MLASAASVRAEPTSQAGPPPSAALFVTAGARGSTAELDTRIRESLEKLGHVKLTATPGLDLAGVQLALDCMDESVRCLRAVSTKLGVEVLVSPTLEHGEGELVLTLLAFDARGTGGLTRVVRWQAGDALTADTLAAVPTLVRGLFPATGATSAPSAAVAPQPRAADDSARSAATEGNKLPLAPLVVLASGAAILGAGVITGLVGNGTENDYLAARVETREEAQAANDLRDSASTQATVANVLLGAGGAAIAVGGTWLAIELLGSREPERRASAKTWVPLPVVGPGQVGLVWRQRGSWL